MRYNYEDEAQDAIDGLDGEPRKKKIIRLRSSTLF